MTRVLLVGVPLVLLTLRIGEARVREVSMDERSMGSIFMRMGQATILRFKEKPKKVVIGNKNYFNIEFVDNDITLQPLGIIATNLFVYGDHRIYGMKVQVTSTGEYDDLLTFAPKPLEHLGPELHQDFILEKTFYCARFRVYVLELQSTKKKSDFKIYQGPYPIAQQFIVWSPERKRARIFFKREKTEKAELYLKVTNEGRVQLVKL